MARGRRGLDLVSGESFDDIKPDPSRVGGVAEAPFVRLPNPATLFASRGRRLLELAPGHTLEAYLRFLAGVVATQAAAVTALPPPAPVPAGQIAVRAEHGFPPVSGDQVRGNADFAATLDWLLDHATLDGAPDAAREAVASVRAMTGAERSALAADMLEGAYAVDRVAESLFVAAALQVHLARLAAQLDAKAVTPPAEGVCPVCGGAPVSSVVVGWTQASKARYCACSLCGTLWNHVRIKCTACGSTDGIAYYTIEDGPETPGQRTGESKTGESKTGESKTGESKTGESKTGESKMGGSKTGGSETVGVETCTACRSYIKHLQQHEDSGIDPVADDVASYALDLLAREQDFRRSSLNPLFLTG